MARVHIGTSGFFYSHWRNVFYPQDLPQAKWFEYYCQHFDTVELNVSFYRLPKKETFEKWRRIASISGQDRAHLRGEGKRSATAHLAGERRCRPFIFAIKGNRYITHVKKLKGCREAVGRFFGAADGLRNADGKREAGSESGNGGGKWGKRKAEHSPSLLTSRPASHFSSSPPNVVLWQLPPRFRAFGRSDLPRGRTSSGNLGRLREFLGLLPKDWRQAFEFRDESWNNTRVFKLIRQFGAAIVTQDYPGWPIIQEMTADFIYLRFHGRQTLYSSCYTEKELEGWAKKIRGWTKRGLDVYTYFNNDAMGHAVENAKELLKLL